MDFVDAATTEGGPGWIAPEDRIAVFDNDGTLWSEQLFYFQLGFVIDRIREMGPPPAEMAGAPALQGRAEGRCEEAIAATGKRGAMELLGVTHAGMSPEGVTTLVSDWLPASHHPKFDPPCNGIVFQPMREALDDPRANGFRTWIVSGGGTDFMRAFAEQADGIPPERVIGSEIGTEHQLIDGKPGFLRKAEVASVDDGPGKPVAIERPIGPVIAFGNSDRDYEMLDYTTAGEGPRLGLIVTTPMPRGNGPATAAAMSASWSAGWTMLRPRAGC